MLTLFFLLLSSSTDMLLCSSNLVYTNNSLFGWSAFLESNFPTPPLTLRKTIQTSTNCKLFFLSNRRQTIQISSRTFFPSIDLNPSKNYTKLCVGFYVQIGSFPAINWGSFPSVDTGAGGFQKRPSECRLTFATKKSLSTVGIKSSCNNAHHSRFFLFFFRAKLKENSFPRKSPRP